MKVIRVTVFTIISALILYWGINIMIVLGPLLKEVNLFTPKYSITIDNQSDNDIVSIETGIRSDDGNIPQDIYEKSIKSGEKVKIKPSLDPIEEVIYLKYIDSKGNTATENICGYYTGLHVLDAIITIINNGIIVEEQC